MVVRIGIILFGVLQLVGCEGEDKVGAEREREQQARIAELQIKVEALKIRLGPPEEGDPAKDLKKAKASLQEADGRVEALRRELADLTTQRAELEKEFVAYKRKYPIPQ